jgi:hypothetical protein
MENIEVLINGKLTKLGDLPQLKFDGSLTPHAFFVRTRSLDTNGYFWEEVNNNRMTFTVDHPSIRMMTFEIAIEYMESVIENEKKKLEESGDLSWDQTRYAADMPYRRSGIIKTFERLLNDLPIRRANYIRMESSRYPPYWLVNLRYIRRQQEEAAEAAEAAKTDESGEVVEAATRYKSDYFSRDPDILLRPLLVGDNVSAQI